MEKETSVTPQALREAFKEALEHIPDKHLKAFVEANKLVCGGARPTNIVFMRTILLNHYGSTLTTYNKDLAPFLCDYVPEIRFINLFSEDSLLKWRRHLTVFFGKAHLLLGMLADARETVRKNALRWMEESDTDLPDAEEAERCLKQLLTPAITIEQGNSPANNKRLHESLANAEQQITTLRKELKQAHRSAEAEKTKCLREQKALLDSKDFAINEYKRRIEALEKTLEQQREQEDLRVNELLAVRQIKAFRGWLKPLCEIECLAHNTSTAPLLERAANILAAQRKADRAAQVQAEAKHKLKAIEHTLHEVEETLATAQFILPDLQQIQQELSAQRDHYRAVLFAEDELFSSVAKELSARIDACSERDYAPIREWLNVSERVGAISNREAKSLRDRLHRKIVPVGTTEPILKGDEDEVINESESTAIEKRNPHLSKAMRGQGELILFLDGHNILNGIGRYRPQQGRAQTHEDARSHLEKDMKRMFCNLPCVAVHLVWDGSEKTNHSISDNILVHFSGGVGEHKADRYIINQMDYYKMKQVDSPMVLVTNDNGFAGEARKRGVQVCQLHDFEAFINVPRN